MPEGENQRRDKGKLRRFAQDVRVDDNAVLQHVDAADNHHNFLRHHDENRRPREHTGQPLPKQRGADHQLVRQGIHQLAESGNLIVFACKIPVQIIGDAGNDKHGERPLLISGEK